MSSSVATRKLTSPLLIARAIVDGIVALYPWKLLLLPPPPPPADTMEQAMERVSRAFNRSWAETKTTFDSTLGRAISSSHAPPEAKKSGTDASS